MVRVDRLTIADFDVIFGLGLRLLAELGDEGDDLGSLDWDKVLQAWREAGDRFHYLAARDAQGEIVGLLTLNETFAIYASGSHGVIDEMYVAPQRRDQSVGKQLLDAVTGLGRKRGWSRIDVTAPESDRWFRTRQLYEREGFTFTGPKLKYTP